MRTLGAIPRKCLITQFIHNLTNALQLPRAYTSRIDLTKAQRIAGARRQGPSRDEHVLQNGGAFGAPCGGHADGTTVEYSPAKV